MTRSRLRHQLTVKPAVTRKIVYAITGILFAVFLISQRNQLVISLHIISQSRLQYAMVAIGLVGVSVVVAASSYVFLAASSKIRLAQTIPVQLANGLANRLLPAGIAGIGLFILFMTKRGLKPSRAAAVMAANGVIGIFGSLVLLAIISLCAPPVRLRYQIPQLPGYALIIFIAVAAILVIAMYYLRRRISKRLLRAARATVQATIGSLRPSRRAFGSLAANMSLTVINATILVLAASAVYTELSWPAALIVLSAATLFGALVPTPGGLGGVEAGLFTGLLAVGLTATHGLACVILYRVLTYWLPIVPGIFFLPYIRKKYL